MDLQELVLLDLQELVSMMNLNANLSTVLSSNAAKRSKDLGSVQGRISTYRKRPSTLRPKKELPL